MKNLNIPKTLIWTAILVFLITFWFSVGSLFAQTWQNVGNGYQSKVVGGFRDLRVVFTTGNAPYGVTDSLKKKADGFYQIPNGANIVDFTVDGANARVTTSNNYSITGEPQKLAIFFHFYGGNYTSVPSSKLRDSLLNNGYSIASISAGESWGNEKAQQLYVKLYNSVIKRFNVDTRPVAVCTSMGSLTAFNVINRNLIPFRAFINTIGVVNLSEYYTRAVGFDAGNHIQTAYEFTTPADSTKAFFGFDPYTRLKTTFGDTTYKSSCPVYFINGELDTSAPIRFTSRIYNGLNRTYTNSILNTVSGIGHDTAIVTPAIAHDVMLWLNSNPLYGFESPDTAIVLKTNNGIVMSDKTLLPGQPNFIDFHTKSSIRRGLIGFVNADVIGSEGMAWSNLLGNIGVFVPTSKRIALGTISSGVVDENFVLDSISLTVGLPAVIKGAIKSERSINTQYVQMGYEDGIASLIGKNTFSADYASVIIRQGNNTTDRDVVTIGSDGSVKTFGKLNVGTTTDYADNAAALAGGLVVGDVYRTGDILKVVH